MNKYKDVRVEVKIVLYKYVVVLPEGRRPLTIES